MPRSTFGSPRLDLVRDMLSQQRADAGGADGITDEDRSDLWRQRLAAFVAGRPEREVTPGADSARQSLGR